MSKHTPTPWETIGDGAVRDAGGNCIPIYSGFIAEAWHFEEPAIANAAFIVRAVNSHETLVSALKDAVSQLEALTSPLDVPDSCRAALAAEKEEAA